MQKTYDVFRIRPRCPRISWLSSYSNKSKYGVGLIIPDLLKLVTSYAFNAHNSYLTNTRGIMPFVMAALNSSSAHPNVYMSSSPSTSGYTISNPRTSHSHCALSDLSVRVHAGTTPQSHSLRDAAFLSDKPSRSNQITRYIYYIWRILTKFKGDKTHINLLIIIIKPLLSLSQATTTLLYKGGLRVFLGALIQAESAMANLHSASTCSGKANWIPTRGPTNMFSGSGPSKSSTPPALYIFFPIEKTLISIFQFHIWNTQIIENLPGVYSGWLDHSVERPSAWPT